MRGLIAGILALLVSAARATPPPAYPSIVLTPQASTAGLTANGQCATTSVGLFCRIAGSVVGPFGTGGSSGLTLTDGSHTVTGTTQITVTGGAVGGATPNATLTVSGASGLTINSTPITGSSSSHALISDGTKLQQLPYGLTGNNTLVETGSGGLLTASILPLATTSAFGAVKCDGSTITCTSGVIAAIAGGTSNLPVINAAQAPYNVKCDNSTNDTTAIQAAINAAGGNAATIIMPSGQCLISGPLTITTNGINFIGQGGGNGPSTGTALVTNQATGNVITIGSTSANVSGVTIQGISISASVTRTGGAGIYRYSGAWNVIRDVKIYNMWQGYVIDGRTAPSGSGNSDYDNYVYGGNFNANSHGGIIVGVSGNTTADNFPENEFFYNPDVSANGVGGLVLNDCGGCNLSGVQGILNDVGVRVSPGNSQAVGIFSTDLQLDSSRDAALDFEATGTGTFQGQWSNSWLTSTGTSPISGGIYLNPLAVGIRFNSPVSAFGALTFSGGKIYNNAGPGVYEAQNPKYVTFTGVDVYSNSAFNNGAPVCPTATPACNNNGVYPNYLATNGTTNVSLIGGNWGVGAGLSNWPSYGYDIGGGTFTNVTFTGINVAGTVSSGTCAIGGATLTGGIRCGGSANSAQGGIVGVTVSGGVGTGNVTNSTSGSASTIMTCVTGPACTQIAPSGANVSANAINIPSGWTFKSNGVPMAFSGSNNDITSLSALSTPLSVGQGGTGMTSPSLIPGANVSITGSWPNQTINASAGGTVTTAGGSSGNVTNCNNAGCTQITGTSYALSGTSFNPPDNTASLGDTSHHWTDLFLSAESWTPGITIGGSAAGITYTRQNGTYQTLGHAVITSFSVILSATGGLTGAVALTGLPVTAAGATSSGGSCTVGFYNNTASVTTGIFGSVAVSSTTAALFTGSAGGAGSAGLSHANLTTTTQMDGTCTYFR